MPFATRGFWWQLAHRPALSPESKSVLARFWPAPEPMRVAEPLARVAWVVASR